MINKLLVCFFMVGFAFFAKAQAPTHEQFLQACNDSKIGEACWALGYSYEVGKDFHGNQLGKNLSTSVNYYKKGCELKEPRACFNLGNNAGQGIYESIPALNMGRDKGLLYLQKGCSLDHKGSCYNYASVISSFKNGKAKAIWGFKKACKLGVQQACIEADKLK
jgi:TPR repeat protein